MVAPVCHTAWELIGSLKGLQIRALKKWKNCLMTTFLASSIVILHEGIILQTEKTKGKKTQSFRRKKRRKTVVNLA
jgi:hypothetical protein